MLDEFTLRASSQAPLSGSFQYWMASKYAANKPYNSLSSAQRENSAPLLASKNRSHTASPSASFCACAHSCWFSSRVLALNRVCGRSCTSSFRLGFEMIRSIFSVCVFRNVVSVRDVLTAHIRAPDATREIQYMALDRSDAC